MNVLTLLGYEDDDKVEETRNNFIIIVIIAAEMFLVLVIMCAAIARIMALFTYDLRYQSLSALLYYDQQFYDRPESSPGSLSYKLGNDCEKVSSLGGPAFGLQILILAAVIGGVTIAMMYNVVFSLIIVAFTPLMVISSAQGVQLTTEGLCNNNVKKTTLITSDALSNVKTVYSLNSQKHFHKEYIKQTRLDRKNIIKSSHASGLYFGSRFAVLFLLWGTMG